MNSRKNDSKQVVESLTEACQNATIYINELSLKNECMNSELITLKTENIKLKSLSNNLRSQLDKIEEIIKELAILSDITSFEDDSTVDLLTRMVMATKKSGQNSKKRKLNSYYSPLKLSLKDDSELLKNSKNKNVTLNTNKTTWKLSIDRNGNPSDLLKKSKQTILQVQPLISKTKLDVTIQNNVCNETSFNSNDIILSPIKTTAEINSHQETKVTENLKEKISILTTGENCKENTCLDETIFDSINCSISHLNRLNKPINNAHTTKDVGSPEIVDVFECFTNQSNTHQVEQNDSSNETIFSPVNIPIVKSDNTNINECLNKSPNINIFDSFDIIPGLNDKPSSGPNYKYKENPVRKQNERKQLNGWDCEECRKFYEAINDNPVEAKNAMNQFSRHRSIKHQHIADTPPGLWDPL